MSRSQPTLQNPADHLYEWNGGNGTISYYDKETKDNVVIEFKADNPFEMLVLDQLNGVTGWSDRDNIGIWSNETRSTKDDFTVRAGKRTLYVGPYKNDNGISQVAGLGGKYCKIIYFASRNDKGNYTINRFKLTGAALNAWIEFSSQYAVENGKVLLTGSTEGKKGATIYRIPTFQYVAADESENQEAIILDKALQIYLNQYLTAPKYDDNAEPIVEDSFNTDDGKASPEQLAEFERLKAEKLTGTNGLHNSQTPRTTSTDEDADQATYNRQAIADMWPDGEPIPEPPEGY